MIKLKDYDRWATILQQEGFALEYTKADSIRIITVGDQFFKFD